MINLKQLEIIYTQNNIILLHECPIYTPSL